MQKLDNKIHFFPQHWSVSRERMYNFIKKYYLLNRTVVSNDQTKFANDLKKLFDGKIIKEKPGSKCLTWKIPKNWNVKEAYISDLKNNVIIDYRNNPLHLWSYSKSFDGKISTTDLLKHISTDINRPDEFPYHYSNSFNHNYDQWGFSAPYNKILKLKDKFYKVKINSSFDNKNHLQVVTKKIKGRSKKTILIMAHTCHPGIVSDGIACIAAAYEIFNLLKKRKNYYSYEFIFGPEYFAAASYLKRNIKNKKNIKFGIFFDTLSNHEPMTLQKSVQSNTQIDKLFQNIFRNHLKNSKIGNFKEMIGNDELFYNGTNINIPTIGIARDKNREYHYNTDNLENLSLYKLEESIWVIFRGLIALENNKKVKLKYLGPLSRGNFLKEKLKKIKNLDWKKNEKILILANGKNSILDISEKLDVDFYYVLEILKCIPKKFISLR